MQLQKQKEILYQSCVNYVEQRIKNASDAVQESQSAANAETKSTAGDKHDTSRAMMQLAAEQNAKHLAEANKLKQVLHLIDPNKKHDKVELGSLVITSNGKFYISISVGKITLEDEIFFAISPTSPMGMQLTGLSEGEAVNFNGKMITVLSVI